jgi:arsenate reductase
MVDAPLVVFVCEYGSKKSVLAAAYFNHLAQEHGLRARAVARGLNPDPVVPPGIRASLAGEGIDVGDSPPARLEPEEIESAQRVVSFAESVGVDARKLDDWSDVPPMSDDFEGVRAEIRRRVEQMVQDRQIGT